MSTIAPAGHGLPKITVDKLESIGRRRSSLLLTRTAALFVSVFLGLLLASALADRFWNLSDTTRAVFGLSTYTVSIVAVLFSLLPLSHRWSLSDSARITEESVATLRNKLLSAVELPADSTEPRLGSADLRSELQAVVAEEIRGLDLGSVLPWRRIRAIVLAMVGIGLLTGVLILIPSLNLPQHLWRLLLPMADLPRPSLADIQLLDPPSDSAVFALNEPQLFRAQVTLPNSEREQMPERLQLEIRTNESQPESLLIAMKPDAQLKSETNSDDLLTEPAPPLSSTTIFSTLVNIEHPMFAYRIVSEVGETRWYSAQAAERPRVDEFAIMVTPPAYSGASAETFAAASADVEVVAGSQVSWALKTNVPLTQAQLRWRTAASAVTPAVAVVQNDQGTWTFTKLADETRSFQIDLTSEPGLSSTFPPTYQLSVRADHAPQITWQKPTELTRVIRPRSAAILQVAIADEYPLQRLEQWSRVNRGNWRKEVLGTPVAATAEVEWTWEIAVLNAKIGDLIETKIVAVDRKGQTGESLTSEWAVSGTELNPSRDPETLIREEIDRLIARLKPIVHGKQSRLKEATEAWRGDVNNSDATAQLLSEITSSADDVSRLLDDTQTQIATLLGELRNPLTLEEVNLLLDAMTQWTREFRVIQQTLESSVNRETSDQRSGMLDRFRGRFEHSLYSVDRLPLISQAMVSHDILIDFSRDLEDALRFQRELLRDEESIGTKIWQREQQILSEYLTRVGQDMGAHSQFLPDGPARGLREWGQMVEQLGERSASLVEEDGVAAYQVEELANEIRNRVNLFQLYSWLPDEVANMRRELFQHSGKTRDLLIRSMHEWHQERQHSADASVPTAAFLTAMEALWQRRSTRYHRADHSMIYAADLGLTHRALEHQIALNTGNPSRVDQRIQQIAEAVGIIESGQRVENARHLLDAALATERFAATSGIARTENPRWWDAFGQQLEWAHENMRSVEKLQELASVINGLRWTTAAQSVGQKITRRRWDLDQVPVSAASDLESVRSSLWEQERLLQPSVDEARRLLAELAPPIATLAQASAAAVETAQAATAQLQEQLRADEVPNIAERLQQNQTQLEQAREQTSERLQEALVDRAASQNPLDQRQQKQAQVADLARQLAQAAEQRTTQAQAAIQEAIQQPRQDPTQSSVETTQVADALDALKQAQTREVETLQAIAEHFANESNNPAAESPETPRSNRAETLAQLATDPPNALERDAEALAALSEADPRELLRSLEQELTRDEQMQEELSDIARTLAEQSQRSIEHAAQREDDLRQSLEQSDAVREPLRQEFAQELNQAFEEADQIVRRLQNETQEQAEAGQQAPSQEKLTAAAEQLQETIQAAREQAASGLNEDLKQAVQNLNQALQDVQPKLQATQESLAANKDENPFDREDQRQQRQNWANQTQDRLADQDRQQADREIQNRQQQEQRAQQGVQQAQQSVSQAEQQLQQYRDQLKSQPDNEWLKQQVPQAQAQVTQQQAVQKTWEGVRQRAEQRVQEAQQARQQQDQRPSSLDAPNPHTELAERLTQQAANRAAELSEDLNQLMNQVGYMAETKASRRELEQAARQQANVQDQIAAAAQDLQQAAAHQERLGAEQSAEALRQAAQDVTNTANQEPRAAQTQIQQAQAASPDSSEPLQANSNDTQQVDQSLQSANEALQQRANELGQMLGQSTEQNISANQESPVEPNQASEQNSASEQDRSAEQHAAQNSKANSGETAASNAAENAAQAHGQNSHANSASNPPSNSGSNRGSNSNSGNPSQRTGNPILSQMDPRAKAELLDQLSRQLSRSESGEPSPSGESSGQPTAGQSQAALQGLAQSLRRQLQQQRAQQMAQAARTPANSPNQTDGAAMQSGTAAMNGPAGSLTARALATDERANEPVGAWSRLREQKSADVTESQAETVSPRYRRQIENYYKVLSEKSRETK